MGEPLSTTEVARLAALRSQEILDSPRERAFDDIVQLARFVCGVPMALVSLVDENRQWFKARVGLPMTETPREQSFCAHALGSHEPLIIEDTHEDPRFAENVLVLGGPEIRSYAGVPIYVDDGAVAVGTLCVLDRVPRKLSAEQLTALTALARRVETELRLRKSARMAPANEAATVGPGVATGASLRPGALGLSENDVVGARYRIERLLGEGGMGRVYLATDSIAGGRVALKIMAGVSAASSESLERFVREARVLLRIRSANVARLLDAGNLEDGAPYFAMEYLDGHDLSHEPVPMPPAAALALALQACDGVAAIHDAGVVHRDLKPGNLFLTRDGDLTTLKILDFGIAKLARGQDAGDQEVADGLLTGAVTVLGTPRYMSPEQLLSSRDVDASTDIWALGILLYELLTHEHPFEGTSITEICASIFLKQPRPMRERAPAIPAALDEVVLRCLALEKKDRWPTVRALRDALADVGKALD